MLYRVISNILKDHVHYAPGSEIELDDATAQKISHAVEGPIAVEILPLPVIPEPVIEPEVFEPLPEIEAGVLQTEERISTPIRAIVNGAEVEVNAPDSVELGTGKKKRLKR